MKKENILLSKACNECVEDLKKMYIKMQLRDIKIENLKQIVDIINKNLPEKGMDGKIMITMPILYKQMHEDTIKNEEIISNKQNICTASNTKFTSKKLLNHNNLILHRNKSQSKICHICGKHCDSSKALKSHLNCHSEKKCPHCQKTLKTHSHFNKHVISHITNVKRRRNRTYYQCESCPYKTLNKTDLESHKNKMHLKIRPFKCDTCLKSFHKRTNLTAHILTHNKSSKLICDICGSDFAVKKTLIQHLKLHEGVRDYVCEFCKRKFVTHSRKNEHVKRSHSNESFNCLYCPKTYTLRKDLNSHLRRFHDENRSIAGENNTAGPL